MSYIHRLRVSLTATVTTLAGSTAGNVNSVNGTSAKFTKPKGLALSSNGTLLYVADNGNSAIRVITTSNGACPHCPHLLVCVPSFIYMCLLLTRRIRVDSRFHPCCTAQHRSGVLLCW